MRRTGVSTRPGRGPRRGGVRWLALGALAVLALIVFDVAAPYAGFQHPVVVEIPEHSNRWSIAEHLAGAGVVRSAVVFTAWALVHPGVTLKAGAYRFAGANSLPAVFRRLAQGRIFAYSFVVPEGFDRFEIARQLSRGHIASGAAFLAVTANPALARRLDPAAVSLEGYLFPATYSIAPGTSARAIAATMVECFRQALPHAGWRPGLRDPHGQPISFHEWLTVASLVEKETALPSERAVIAGVFYNRLDGHLPLQSDPTVIYADEIAGRPGGPLTTADLHFISPYNTYTHVGLPPGPIANPGLAAMRAASHPAATPYLYFVSNGHGGHRFARTLAGQDRNVRLYLRVLAANKGGR